MDYIAGNSIYILRYQDLVEEYFLYKNMSDDEFLVNIIKILHFSCMVGYLKELPASVVLIDNGIIHELVHLLDNSTKDDAKLRLSEIRKTFNIVMELK